MRYRFFSLLAAAIIAFGIGGCGGGGTSADPLGTDGITLESAASQVASNGTVVLTATVKNESGTAVAGRDVAFGFVANASAATLSTGEASTDTTGVAMVIYRAGGASGVDIVRASISNGAYRDVGITVGTGGTGGGITVTVTPNLSSLSAGAQTIITADVLNADGTPAVGQNVTFTTAPSNSGATDPTPASSLSNAAGKAFATYTAGTNLPGSIVYDVVTANVTGAANGVIITRTASTTGTYAVSIDNTFVTPVTAGQVSIITATVTSGSTDASGVTVTFTLPLLLNNSGATLTTPSGTGTTVTATTDGNGKAVVIYQPGTTNPDTTVQDTVQAAVGTAASAVAITRTGSSTLAYRIAVTADPPTLSLATMNSVVTATVTNNVGTAVSGVTVTFARDASSVVLGTVLPLTMITDGNGKAQTVYTGVGVIAKATGVVKASITIGGNTYTAAVIITNP